MNRTLMVLGLVFFLGGCATCTPPVPVDPRGQPFEGTYRGTIQLLGPAQPYDPAPRQGPVEIRFQNGVYSVKGEVRYLPPIGSGVYALGDQLVLTDRGAHSAEFDWTLILKGAFDVKRSGDDLRLEQIDSNGHHWLIAVQKVNSSATHPGLPPRTGR